MHSEKMGDFAANIALSLIFRVKEIGTEAHQIRCFNIS